MFRLRSRMLKVLSFMYRSESLGIRPCDDLSEFISTISEV